MPGQRRPRSMQVDAFREAGNRMLRLTHVSRQQARKRQLTRFLKNDSGGRSRNASEMQGDASPSLSRASGRHPGVSSSQGVAEAALLSSPRDVENWPQTQ